MNHKLSTLCLLTTLTAGAQILPNPSYTIQPLVGAGRADGRAAVDSTLDGAYGLAEDSAGNVYVSEANAGLIRRIRPDGVMERFAGTGNLGNGGAGKAALETDLTKPTILLVDKDGGLIFYEAAYCRIRKVQTDGIITDLVGTARCGGSGMSTGIKNRRALDTDLAEVHGMVIDKEGRLVFSQAAYNMIRRLDADGYVRTIVGTGTAGSTGDDADAAKATLSTPRGLTRDTEGNLYIADSANCRVRKVDTSGIITAFAGGTSCAPSGATYSGVVTTRLDRVDSVAYDANEHALYISMPWVFRVLRLDMNASRIGHFFGNGTIGLTEPGVPTATPANEPTSVIATAKRGILIAANSSFQVFQVQGGQLSRFAGNWIKPGNYSSAAEIPILRPRGVALSHAGALLITDQGAGFLHRADLQGNIATLSGIPWPAGFWKGDLGVATEATLDRPNRVIHGPYGDLYMTDNARIRVIENNGKIRTQLTGLSDPVGMVFDSYGRLIYSDAGNNKVIRYDFSARTNTTIAGTGSAGFSGDGAAATEARLSSPGDLAFDSKGNLLIADRGNRRIRRVRASDGYIETIAGNGLPLSYANINGMDAAKTGFGSLAGMAIDSNDNIYISESVRVNMITKDGKVKVITGFLAEDDNGIRSYLDGPLKSAEALAVDSAGRVYIVLRQDGQVLVATPK